MCTSSAVCYFRAPSGTILTSLQPAVNPLPGCSSGNPFKTNWREGLSCSSSRLLSTAFDLRPWTMVVSWKEDSGRQLQLITPDNERGDETRSPSPPRFTFFDDPDVPLDPPDTPPAPPGPPGLPDSPGLLP